MILNTLILVALASRVTYLLSMLSVCLLACLLACRQIVLQEVLKTFFCSYDIAR